MTGRVRAREARGRGSGTATRAETYVAATATGNRTDALDSRRSGRAEYTIVQDLQFAPAHEIAAAVRRRALSPVEVMQATIARLERLNPALNEFIALRCEDALADAR